MRWETADAREQWSLAKELENKISTSGNPIGRKSALPLNSRKAQESLRPGVVVWM